MQAHAWAIATLDASRVSCWKNHKVQSSDFWSRRDHFLGFWGFFLCFRVGLFEVPGKTAIFSLQSTSVFIHLHQSVSISINICQSLSFSISMRKLIFDNQSLSTSINLYQPLSTSTNLYQSVSSCSHPYQFLQFSTPINLCRPLSAPISIIPY